MTNSDNSLPIEVNNLDVILGATRILSNVNLRVASGESVALLGANGSGKSTLVKALVGINPLSAGSVKLFGTEVTHRRQVPWQRVGYVPQRVAASSGIPATALEVVRSGLIGPHHPFADRGRKARAAAMAALEAVHLADRAHDHVQVFSGGQAQRVLIARALVRSPELLLMDEPLAGIDRDSREALAQTLQGLRDQGITLVTVLHEMAELRPIVERSIILADGQVIHDGDPSLEHQQAAHPGEVGCEHLHPHSSDEIPPHHAPVLESGLS